MDRAARLQSARSTQWAANYSGKNVVRGYCKWYGVDPICAVVELRELGIPISAEREEEIRKSVANRAAAHAEQKQRRKQAKLYEYPDSDEAFAFVADYTSEGSSNGVTWEGFDETPLRKKNEQSEPANACDSERAADIPF